MTESPTTPTFELPYPDVSDGGPRHSFVAGHDASGCQIQRIQKAVNALRRVSHAEALTPEERRYVLTFLLWDEDHRRARDG